MESTERIVSKLVGTIAAVMILVSSVSLHYISLSWQSVYPVLGDGTLSLPVPTKLALFLTEIPSLIVLSAVAGVLFVASRYWIKPINNSIMLILLIVLVWFGGFVFINWGLALPFIDIEITL